MPHRKALLRYLIFGLIVISIVGVAPNARAPGSPRDWILSGQGFAAGSFQGTVLAAPGLQLVAQLPPSNRSVVVDVGPPGSADSVWATAPSVLHESDGSYKMWYTGFDGYRTRILLAVSPDGLRWTKVGIVLDVSNGAETPFVMRMGSSYEMFFTEISSGGSLGYLDEIYRATSADGVNWTVQGLALGVGSAGSWDEGTVANGWIVQDGTGLYRMYYAGWNGNANVQIGVATSPDLINWTRWGRNPVLTWGSAGAWDSGDVGPPCVLVGATWVLYYGGRQNSTANQIGIARSTDGYNWTKDPANPVIGWEAPQSWDNAFVSNPDLVTSSPAPRLYFGGGDGSVIRTGVYTFGPPPAVTYVGAYTSPVFDSGAAGTTWATLTADSSTPPGTSVSLAVRVGNVSTADATWSAWTPAGQISSLERTRYAELAINMTSDAWNSTPTVASVTLGYAPDAAPLVAPWAPPPGAWTNAVRPLLRWNQSDSEGDAIVAERVQVSTAADFALIAAASGNLTPGTTSWQVSYGLAEGTWYWRVQAEDVYGLWSTWQSSVFRIDTTPPLVAIANPAPGQILHASSLDIVWVATDALSGVDHVEVSVDGGAPVLQAAGNSTYILSGLSDGAHVVRVTAFDRAGNSATFAVSFAIDTAVFSVNGPDGAWPIIAVLAAAVVVSGLVAILWWQRRRPPKPQQP